MRGSLEIFVRTELMCQTFTVVCLINAHVLYVDLLDGTAGYGCFF